MNLPYEAWRIGQARPISLIHAINRGNMSNARRVSLLIIGSGPAGYTAGVYGARAMLKPVIYQGLQPGGQLMVTTDVENWPGETSILGPDLMARMEEQAHEAGCEIVTDIITEIDLSRRPFRAVAGNGDLIAADTVILATGAQAKWLGLPSEEKFQGFGVSACATCDGFFYRDKEVVVVGGGNTAVEEALFLTNFASKVTVVHRGDHFRAEKILQERLFAHPKIEVLWNHEVDEILGSENPLGVERVRVRHSQTGDTQDVACSGIFVAIGHSPASDLVQGQLETYNGGYVKVSPGTTSTSIPGVFAAGDLTDHVYRQAVTSAGMGCMAALEAERFLSSQ